MALPFSFNNYRTLGASRVDERLDEALKRGPGSKPWYEKYVRVFYREIFLDKADDGAELGFWLCQMLSPLPLVYQARMLYILYGPEDSNEGMKYI
jgi:F-box protein 47